MWHPVLTIEESVNSVQEIGSSSNEARVASDGTVRWISGNVIHVFCPVDVFSFPFDKQTCTVSLNSINYTPEELTLRPSIPELQTARSNSKWELEHKCSDLQIRENVWSSVQITLCLKRRSGFYLFHAFQ